jgi:hypothetical protein
MESKHSSSGAALTPDEIEMTEATAAVTDSEPGRRSKGSEERSRLVVELSALAAGNLNELCQMDQSNKTTVVNRAIKVYHVLRTAEAAGGEILISDSKRGQIQRMLFIP